MPSINDTAQSADFLPTTPGEVLARGWADENGSPAVDFVLVSGDAYVDHPSFGAAIIGRVLQAEGYRVAMLPQPGWGTTAAFRAFGRPRLAFLVSGGVVDSMVAHYTVAKRRRTFDEYSPGGRTGLRPDRCVEVYAKLAKQAYPDAFVVIGGLEASLRRFAHYDYWTDTVRPSILETSGADLLSFGMGERSLREIAARLAADANATAGAAGSASADANDLTDIAGTAWLADFAQLPAKYAECASYAKVKADKAAYAKACRIQHDNQDPVSALPLVQKQGGRYLVQNLPAAPLDREELDAVYALPFTRRWHPMYDAVPADAGAGQDGAHAAGDDGKKSLVSGVPALEEVAFSIAHNRGCFGGCNFCAITLHQGRRVHSRSEESVLAEARRLTQQPGFKGYIHDVGGPTANFRAPSCTQQLEKGVCKGARRCLAPLPCPKLRVDHSEYLAILRKMRALPGVKKVFIRSGIRFDYLVHDRDERFFRELVEHHVSGQLKVAPEHCAPAVLRAMGKPPVEVYERFEKRFYELSRQAGREQYLVPYLLSSHPGSTLRDAVALAAWLHKHNLRPEQVQDFYPTPGTVSTCMFYTGLDPYTGEEVHVPRKDEEKALQRALLQYFLPKNARLVHKALLQCHREDLIPVLLPASARRGAQTGTSTPRAKGSPPAKGEGKNTGKKDASARGRAAGKAPTGRGNDWGKTAGKASIGRGGKPGKAAGSSAGTPAGPPRRSRKDNSKPGRPGRRRA